jgi:hypothetical protein
MLVIRIFDKTTGVIRERESPRGQARHVMRNMLTCDPLVNGHEYEIKIFYKED